MLGIRDVYRRVIKGPKSLQATIKYYNKQLLINRTEFYRNSIETFNSLIDETEPNPS